MRALLTVLMDVHNDSHQVQGLEVVERGCTDAGDPGLRFGVRHFDSRELP